MNMYFDEKKYRPYSQECFEGYLMYISEERESYQAKKKKKSRL